MGSTLLPGSFGDNLNKFDPGGIFGSITGRNGPQTGAYEGNPDLSQFGPSPYSSSLQQMISGFKPAATITPTTFAADTSSYQAKDYSKESLPEYDAMRTRLNSQYSQQQSQGQDALDRQFAAMGGGPGNGAQAKQTENLATGIASAKSNDLLGINTAEAQARRGLQEQENQRAFESGEAAKGRGFQAGLFNAGQNTQAQEFNAQMGMQGQQFQFGAASTIAGLNTSWDQAQAEARNNEYNKALSDYQAAHSGGLLGGGGFLGLGL